MTTDRTILESDTAERDREILADVRAGWEPSAWGEDEIALSAISRARAEERESKWQDIATAPNGTMMLCSMSPTIEARDWCWVDWVADGKPQLFPKRKPTHWCPLPPPPSSGRG